jgi:hypothetical protein
VQYVAATYVHRSAAEPEQCCSAVFDPLHSADTFSSCRRITVDIHDLCLRRITSNKHWSKQHTSGAVKHISSQVYTGKMSLLVATSAHVITRSKQWFEATVVVVLLNVALEQSASTRDVGKRTVAIV